MSYLDCLNKAKISAASRKEAADIYNDLYQQERANGLTDVDADAIAAKETADILEVQKAAEKKRAVKTIQTQRTILKNLDTYKNANGEADYAEAALAMFETNGLNNFPAIEGRRKVILGQTHAQMAGFLEEFEAKYVGTVIPKSGLKDVVRALFGDTDVNSSAKELADAVTVGLESLRMRANRAGANIGKKDNYGMPQTHDRVKVAKVAKDDWVGSISGKLDWDKMVDPNTGKSIPPLRRQAVLEGVYDAIKTDGYSKLKDSEMRRVGGLDKRMANHRFLEFKSADDWLDYHENFGVGTPFDVIVAHTDKMARDIAMMEIFGPNPNNGKEFLKNAVKKRAADMDVANKGASKRLETQQVEGKLSKLDEMYAVYMNTNSGASGNMFASVSAGTRNLITSSFLGSASLLAITGDTMTKAITKRFNGLPATMEMSKYLKLMNPLDAGDRKLAARSGLINEQATALAFGQERFTGEILGPQWTRRVADVVLRASLLTPHTQYSRWAFGMETFGLFADNAAKGFDDVPFKPMLERHGITPVQWDKFRATKLHNEKGSTFLRPDDVRVREDLDAVEAQDLADIFSEMVMDEMEYAVPTGTLRARTFLTSDTRAGTIVGELARSGAMFKNFPVTILMTHGRRGLNQETLAKKTAYIAAFGVGMTTMGALGLQMRQISQGKDPMDMNPENEDGRKFWASAALSGGGMGIWGDFLFQNLNRYGGSMGETVAGPVLGFLGDTKQLTMGNAKQLVTGEDTNFGSEATRFAAKYAPAKSLWWARLVLQREIFDQLLLQTDPEAGSKFRSQARRMRKTTGQEHFWPAGKSLLRGDEIRAPNMEDAFQQ